MGCWLFANYERELGSGWEALASCGWGEAMAKGMGEGEEEG